MIDVGIAGTLGVVLAWLCALLLLAHATVTGRVVWAYVVRGARAGALPVLVAVLVTQGLLIGAVAHFATTPQKVAVHSSGDWSVHNAYGWTIETVAAQEVRQVRLTSPASRAFSTVEVKREDGRSLMLYGEDVLFSLGYAFNECGAWTSRPVWGPHAFSPLGPTCQDAPWPATVRNTVPVRSLASR